MGVAAGSLLDSRPLPVEYRPAYVASAFRVDYQSVGYDGVGRAVSGSVFLPATGAPARGWPVVSRPLAVRPLLSLEPHAT